MQNKRIFSYTKELLYFLGMVVFFIAASFIHHVVFGLYMLGSGALAVAIFYFFFVKGRIDRAKALSKALSAIKYDLYDMADAPSFMTDRNDVICWYNNAFLSLVKTVPDGKTVQQVLPGLSRPSKDKTFVIDGVTYTKESFSAKEGEEDFVIHRLLDTEAAAQAKKTYAGLTVVVCLVQIDNYEEMLPDIKSSEQSSALSAIYTAINRFATNVKGIFLQYDKDKFMIVFERRFLNSVMSQKFKLLDEVRGIKLSNNAYATLSIAVGAGATPLESNEYALKSLQLAQGRGGNQAVVKQGDKTLFFGGAQKSVERRSRVKTRNFSQALRNLMEQCSEVFIMGHEMPDLDCMGAALGLLRCARHAGRQAYIVLEKSNASVDALVSAIRNDREYEGVLIGAGSAAQAIRETSMLIAVDTQIARSTEAPDLLGRCETLVVIDHHFRGTEFIEDAALLYHEPYASSTCELVTEIVQYFDEDIVLKPMEAEALLAGITIDTKGFSFKTGVRTFEAASYLRRSGADTISIRQLFQDDLATYSNRVEVVRNARIVKNGIAISQVPKGMENSALIAAQAADSLLTIRGVTASFVLSAQDDNVLVSARSLGGIHVQLVLEKLGGGGHATVAGAKIRNSTIKETMEKLITAIDDYLKEERET